MGASLSVAVIGTGYVGLVSGACLAEAGHRVICVDKDARRVQAVARGEPPIHEDGLPALLRRNLDNGRLRASADVVEAVEQAQVIMITVGTPSTESGIDLSAMESAAQAVGHALAGRRDFPVVAVKSTVTPGTTAGLIRRALEAASGGHAGESFGLAVNPEFLSQGSAVHDFQHADRIVVGQWDPRSGDVMAALYAPFAAPLLRMSLADAELAKYAANFLQAMLISYANQMAALCENTPQADVERVLASVHLDRILDGPDGERAGAVAFLKAGIGFGGSCFPKDLAALAAHARHMGVPAPLVDATLTINAIRPAQALALLASATGGVFERTIAVLGLAFKPGTDDLRDSPGLGLIRRLTARGAHVVAHDPLPAARQRARDRGLNVAERAEDALAHADAAIIATAWPEYRSLAWTVPVVLDGRGVLTGHEPPGVRVLRVGVGPEAL